MSACQVEDRGFEFHQSLMKCKACKSSELTFSKHVLEQGDKKSFHYKAHCSCGNDFYVPRTQEIYKKVKNKRWILENEPFKRSKLSEKQKLKKMGSFAYYAAKNNSQ